MFDNPVSYRISPINRHLFWTLPHPREALCEWLRVTKKGGRVIIIDGGWFDDSPVIRFRKKLLSLFDCSSGRKHTAGRFYHDELIKNLPRGILNRMPPRKIIVLEK